MMNTKEEKKKAITMSEKRFDNLIIVDGSRIMLWTDEKGLESSVPENIEGICASFTDRYKTGFRYIFHMDLRYNITKVSMDLGDWLLKNNMGTVATRVAIE